MEPQGAAVDGLPAPLQKQQLIKGLHACTRTPQYAAT